MDIRKKRGLHPLSWDVVILVSLSILYISSCLQLCLNRHLGDVATTGYTIQATQDDGRLPQSNQIIQSSKWKMQLAEIAQ